MTTDTATTTKDASGEELLEQHVSSLRSRKSLLAAGFVTVSDLRGPGRLKKALGVKYVGEATRLELERAAGPEAVESLSEPENIEQDPSSVEEGPQPLTLQLTRGSHLRVCYLTAHRVEGPGRSTLLEEPLYLEFEPWVPKGPGVAKLSRELYFMKKYERDRRRAAQAVASNEPWRVEAAKDLKRFSRFGIDFVLLTD